MSEAVALQLPSPRASGLGRVQPPGALERWWRWSVAPLVGVAASTRDLQLRPLVARILRQEATMRALDDGALRQRAREAGLALRRREQPAQQIALFAALREAAARKIGLLAYGEQIHGAMALCSGSIVEMATGEGKTLVAALAAAAAALSGRRVHVVTVNDYLAERDGESMAPLFAFLGLEAATIVNATTAAERPARYRAAVVYVSNKELGFDVLRDRVAESAGQTMTPAVAALLGRDAGPSSRVPSLDFAIVDEVDSVLVDEARTPLILSGEAESEFDQATCDLALTVAQELRKGHDYQLFAAGRQVRLSNAGQRRLDSRFATASDRWASPLYREELVTQALAARWLFRRGRDYLVRDGKVEIVDEYTGRAMPDRAWRMGLHQLIEAKEGLELTNPRLTLGHITYQSLFRRYRRLSGMSGTVAEVAGELWQVFAVTTLPIPTHRACRRELLANRVFVTTARKMAAVVQRIIELHRQGVPVLVGTRSVAASQDLAALLQRRGLDFALLNAAQDADEAAIIARAGEPGRITLATNMAGRGTDIRIAPAALSAGGLHVLMTERHEAARIDRQLAGRCARQGDPGVFQAFLSLEDDLLDPQRLSAWLRITRRIAFVLPALRAWLVGRAQGRLERAHAKARRQLLQSEGQLDRVLALTGTRE